MSKDGAVRATEILFDVAAQQLPIAALWELAKG
jgi:hypothetical protein